MKIINVIGGLGNQMFQYAFYLSLCNVYKDENVFVDLHHFNGYKLHNGFELDKIFYLNDFFIATKENVRSVSRFIPNYFWSRVARKLLPKLNSEYLEKNAIVFEPEVFNIRRDMYFEGYWSSPLYFDSIRNEICRQFQFKDIDEYNRTIAEGMLNEKSVSMHIRRGDYVNSKNFGGICDLNYYKNAINYFLERYDNLKFYIFSNDIPWCKENIYPLLALHKVKFIEHNFGKDSYKDIYLMSFCKNMIIANSSFSWWAAYLNKNECPIIISPSKWLNESPNSNIHLDRWLKL